MVRGLMDLDAQLFVRTPDAGPKPGRDKPLQET